MRVAKTRKEKEVWEACNTLKKNSCSITYYAIGEQLVKLGYKRGSNSDIRRYLSTWKKCHSSTLNQKTPLAHLMNANQPSSVPLSPSVIAQQEILSLTQHYAQQFDRLLKINDVLRKENNHLKNMIERGKKREQDANLAPHPPTFKPRYTLKAVFENAPASQNEDFFKKANLDS